MSEKEDAFSKATLKGVAVRQVETNLALRKYAEKQPKIENDGNWHWKEYEVDVQKMSAVVLGESLVGDRLEIVSLVTLHSKHAIPHAGETHRVQVKPDGSHVTFVQLGNSAYTPNFTSVFMRTYAGTEPPVVDHPPPSS